jgi:hypothetical protein
VLWAVIIRSAAGLGAGVLVVGLAAPTVAAPACPAAGPVVAVELQVPEPVIDNTLPQLTVQRLAGKMHHGGRTLGLYRTELKTEWEESFGRRDDGGETCVWIERITLRLTMPVRVIYIVRQRQPGTCPYESVLAHERRHQVTDDALLAEAVPSLRQAVAEALATLPAPRPVPVDAASNARRQLAEPVNAVVRRILAAFSATREARQAEVDTPQEYRRVRAACG